MMHDNIPASVREACQAGKLPLTEEIVAAYSLDTWASEFSLMTAGYRDPLDPNDPASTDVPFNMVTVAIIVEAKARVFGKKLAEGEQGHVHVGGETRPHTQTFIQLAARIYAAHGLRVHLRRDVTTTPIWYSSFGVFYEEYQSGDNFTASHSQYFKGGWKPLDASGQQLLAEEADIVSEVRTIVAERQPIALAPWDDNPLIAGDFDVDDPYLAFQRTVIPEQLVDRIVEAGDLGFRVDVCTMGGAMRRTTERLFAKLGVSTGEQGPVRYFLSQEDSNYHGIGSVDGMDIGVDPGKPRIYRKLLKESGLLKGDADLLLLWDPDGDRLNIVTKAPASVRESALAAGLKVDDADGNECIVCFSPNQLYLMLAALRIDMLHQSGQLHDRDWFMGLSYPTTRTLEELARIEGLKCVRVPVGFKYLGSLCAEIERQLGGDEIVFTDTTGESVNLGRNPRALILCEESGGGTLGGTELLTSRSGTDTMLALREKDAMQLGLLSLCLGATLHLENTSFAEHYCNLVSDKGIRFLHYSRADVLLYDESLVGADLRSAKEKGLAKRDKVMAFFGRLADEHKAERLSLRGVHQAIAARAPAHADALPPLTRACRAGEDFLHGVLFETKEMRFIVRASGTDALLRYYVESTDRETVDTVLELLRNLDVA